jgi:hypothetical protein
MTSAFDPLPSATATWSCCGLTRRAPSGSRVRFLISAGEARRIEARLARFGLNQAVLCKSRAKNSGKAFDWHSTQHYCCVGDSGPHRHTERDDHNAVVACSCATSVRRFGYGAWKGYRIRIEIAIHGSGQGIVTHTTPSRANRLPLPSYFNIQRGNPDLAVPRMKSSISS